MVRKFVIAAVSAAVVALSPAAFAQQTRGTAREAKAMLVKAIAAVKADKTKALEMFNKGEGGFRTGTSTCFAQTLDDGTFVAVGNPNLRQALGVDVRTGQNSDGQGVWRGSLRGDAEAGRSNHRGQLCEPNAGRR